MSEQDMTGTLLSEIGARALSYMETENSDWAYKCWWMTPAWWWDAGSRSFVKETRKLMLGDASPEAMQEYLDWIKEKDS